MRITKMKNITFFLLCTFVSSLLLAAEPFIIKDKDGDEIEVLDHNVRMNNATEIKVGASNVFDSDKKLKATQATLNRNLALAHLKKFGIYTVVAGDTFEKISEKIYGKPNRADEIKVLNEQKLEDNLFRPGLKLVYLKE